MLVKNNIEKTICGKNSLNLYLYKEIFLTKVLYLLMLSSLLYFIHEVLKMTCHNFGCLDSE